MIRAFLLILLLVVPTLSWAQDEQPQQPPAQTEEAPTEEPEINGDEAVRRGVDAYQKRDFQRAVKELESGLKAGLTEYKPALIHTIIGNAYDEMGQAENSVTAHKKALGLEPSFHEAWVNLGVAYRHNGQLDEAEKCYQKALEIEPDYAELHASLGALYIFRSEPAKAVESLDKALELDDQLAIAHANISIAYAMLGRFEEAEQAVERAEGLGYRNGPAVRAHITELKGKAPEQPDQEPSQEPAE